MSTGTSRHQKAVGQGMAASATRERERVKSPLLLHHNLTPHRASLLLQQLERHLPLGCSLVPVAIPDVDALAASEARVRQLLRERDELLQKVQQLESPVIPVVPSLPSAAEDTRQWVTIAQAAEILGVSYWKVWRAIRDNRMMAKDVGNGAKKSGWLCLASTYHKRGTVSA